MKQINFIMLMALVVTGCLDYRPTKIKFGQGGVGTGDSNGEPPIGEGDGDPGPITTSGPTPSTPTPGMPGQTPMPTTPTVPAVSTFKEKPISSYADLGPVVNSRMVDGVIVTEGVIRPRRRHENDMDFAKFNPFYWQGRESFFKIEDYTAKGQNRIKFSLTTEWPQNYIDTRGPDFSAIYKGDPLAESETTRSKFEINARMKHVSDFKNFEAVIDEGAFSAHANYLKKGEMLMFEFRFFLDEANPDWKRQKDANHHNLSAYYSEFWRMKIGEPGLFIDDFKSGTAFPAPQRHSGGWLTTAMIKVEPWRALQQQSINLLRENSQTFLNGRTWFHTDMVDGVHKGDEADDKPSVFFQEDIDIRKGHAASAFNVRSCNTCHYNNGEHLLPDQGQPVVTTLVKTTDKATGMESKVFGNQLQPDGANSEGTLKVTKVETSVVKLMDGTEVTLKKNIFDIDSKLSKDGLGMSIRRPMSLAGVGLLNTVSDDTIKSFVGRQGGTVSLVNGKVSRFGWKADQPKLIDQIGAALRNDLGVRNDLFPKIDCSNGCKEGKAQLPLKTMEEMETYISLLGVPPRRDPTNAKVMEGEKIFRGLGCANCHIPTMTTGDSKFKELSKQTIQPFTDLLLHDLGPALADDSGKPNASKWRTAPLWALKNVRAANLNHTDKFASGNIMILWTDTHKEAALNPIQLLHDGRASSIQEAVLWHGGEALSVVNAYKALTKEQRETLEAFIWDL